MALFRKGRRELASGALGCVSRVKWQGDEEMVGSRHRNATADFWKGRAHSPLPHGTVPTWA
jgi:hypothetical protein